MYSPESKKLALTRIKEIFETYSDFEHPLTQNDIAEHLDHDYGINIDRKTIGRNISLLKETGIEIESDHRGSYLGSRLFEDSELRMLIDGILCSKYITAKHSEDLIKRICGLSNIYFRSHIKNMICCILEQLNKKVKLHKRHSNDYCRNYHLKRDTMILI